MKQTIIITFVLIVLSVSISMVIKNNNLKKNQEETKKEQEEKQNFSLIDIWRMFAGNKDPETGEEEEEEEIISENIEEGTNENNSGIA